MDAFAQFRNMPKEPQLWDTQKDPETLNWTTPQKNLDWAGIYWSFAKQQWKNPDLTTLKETINPENLDEIPEFKIIEWLQSKWHIDEKKYSEIIKELKNSQKWDEKNIIKKFIENNITDNNIKETVNKTIDWNKEIDENNFEKSDFYKSATDKNINIDLDLWVWHIEIMMAENYVEIPENQLWEGKESNEISDTKETDKKETDKKEDALDRTMEITMNKIIAKNWNDFKTNKDVVEIVWKIKESSDLNSKYKNLKDLWELDLIDDAKKWWTKSFEAKRKANSKKENIEKKIKEIEKYAEQNQDITKIEKIKEIEKKLKNELENSTNNLKKIEIEIQKVEWVINSWKLDKNPESKEK